MRSLLWYPVPRTVSVAQEFTKYLLWIIIPQLWCGWAVFCQFVCQQRSSIVPGNTTGQNHLEIRRIFFQPEWAERKWCLVKRVWTSLPFSPSNLFFLFLMAAVISAADQFCLLLILFYLGFHYIHYLLLCFLCRFLFILLSQFMRDTHDWVLRPVPLCMCSPLKSSSNLYSLNYSSGSQS